MSYGKLLLWFPVVLGAHNLEEWFCREQWLRQDPRGRLGGLRTPCAVRAAMMTVTLAAVGMVVAATASRGGFFLAVSRAAIFGLLLNGLGHGLLSVGRGKIVPGTWSAVLFVMPYSAMAVMAMRVDFGDSQRVLLRYAGLGAVGMPVVIGLCLLLGAGWCQGSKQIGVLFWGKG